ncbi:MAG: glycosyltransferase family 2 protein [Candidatus Helarchaeota archaeon]
MIKEKECPHVSIIILNWNGWEDTIECLESLYRIDYPNYDVILVDNASSDNSIAKIESYCQGGLESNLNHFSISNENKPIQILKYNLKELIRGKILKEENKILNLPPNQKLTLIINDKNYLFVKGNNFALKYFVLPRLKTDYILLLNNDTVVEPTFLSELIEIAEKDEKIGIIGPRISKYDDPEHTEWSWLQNMKNHPVEQPYLSGAALLFKRKLIDKIGLLDERYIHYIEDYDYCHSAREAGYKVVHYPTKSKVLHKGSVAQNKVSGLVIFFRQRNYFLYKRKHLNSLQFFYFLIWYFTKKIFIELRKYPKKRQFVVRGVLNGISLILKDKTLLFKK